MSILKQPYGSSKTAEKIFIFTVMFPRENTSMTLAVLLVGSMAAEGFLTCENC